MQLHPDWKWILKRTWSVRFLIIGAIFSAITASIGVITAYQVELPIGPITLSIICGVATLGALMAGIVARIVKQKGPEDENV